MVQIKQTRTTRFTGRNGQFKQVGFTLSNQVDEGTAKRNIVINPITSKDIVGHCAIEIPIEDVPHLIVALQAYVK